jgi:cytochrome c-type biogenesis protein CcmH/NrfG
MNLPFGISVHRMPRLNPEDEITRLRSTLAESPDDAQAHLKLAAYLYQTGELTEAEAQYKRAIALFESMPTNPPIQLQALAYEQLGSVLNMLSRTPEAHE